MLNMFALSPNWYGSPQRGQVPVGWTMAPGLSQLAPTVMDAIYRNATVNVRSPRVSLSSHCFAC